MRTTVQLAQRLARHLDVPDPANLDATAALDVLGAINAGIQCYYRELPPLYKRTTLSHTLRAPRQVTLLLEGLYSNLVLNEPFTTADRGATVRIEGQPDNEVTAEDRLLDDYLGTATEVAATVYGDAVPLEDVIERIVAEPYLHTLDGGCRTTLVRDERLAGQGGYWPERRTVAGVPRCYALLPVGGSQGGEPAALLRVHPLPDRDYTLRLQADLGPRLVTFADLSTPAKIPVPEERVDDLLLPLCEAELVTSPYWRDASKAGFFADRAERVLARRAPMVPAEYGARRNRVGRPVGF